LPKCQKENVRSGSEQLLWLSTFRVIWQKRKFKIFLQPTKGHTNTHIHTQRENNGKRIYFATNENNENNANRGAGTACLASKNIFIDIFALFKCRILYPTQNHLVFHLSVMHKIKPYFRINKL